MAKTVTTKDTSRVSGDGLFEDLGFSAEEAALLQAKSVLHAEIRKHVERQGLKPRDLERTLGISQPKVSDLLNGKISSMTLDRLTKYLHRLGRQVKITTTKLQSTEVA